MVAMPVADAAPDAVARLAPNPHAACDLSALAPKVSGLMGRDVFVEDAPLIIRIAVAAHGDRRAARVELVARDRVTGVRTLEAAPCDELVAAMSVVLSLALRDRVHGSLSNLRNRHLPRRQAQGRRARVRRAHDLQRHRKVRCTIVAPKKQS